MCNILSYITIEISTVVHICLFIISKAVMNITFFFHA